MTEILTALTEVAVAAFRSRNDDLQLAQAVVGFLPSDPALAEAQRRAFFLPTRLPGFDALVSLLLTDPDLAAIAPIEGQLDPMLVSSEGGVRRTAGDLIGGLFSAARLWSFWLAEPETEAVYVRRVLAGVEQLRRAAKGEVVDALSLTGVCGVKVREGHELATPWGTVRPSPRGSDVQTTSNMFEPSASSILVRARPLAVRLDRSPEPAMFYEADSVAERSRTLLPLSFALASDESDPRAGILTWSTTLLPFAGSLGFHETIMLLPPWTTLSQMTDVPEVEDWARLVDRNHSPSVDVAARRLVSAIAQRMDPADALVDSVMAWENLVGTSTEVTFRVTAALAKMLESDLAKRQSLRKDLARVYDIRSKLVHGEAVEAELVQKARIRASQVAISAMRVCYRKGPEFMSLNSGERGDAVVLEWP